MVLNGFLQILEVILLLDIVAVHGLRCIQCSQTNFHGEPGMDECYKLEDSTTVNETNCIVEKPDSYCFTKIELSDGILSYLERGCTNPREDTLHASDEYPDSVKCTTSYQTSKHSNHIQQTECYMPCKGDKCNDKKILHDMTSCPDVCPINSECNYLTGKCQCAPNRYGDNCTSTAPMAHKSRTCLQCNSKTDPECANKTMATRCQNGETHCSTAQTWILKSDGTSDSDPVVTRSCTSQYLSPDRCYLTKTGDLEPARYTEYTCVSTCSADNCNTGTANGVIDDEFIPKKCVVCEGDEKSCGPERKLTTDCPSGTTHCLATVTYWETIVTDSKLKGRLKPDPSVSVRSIKRECSLDAVARKCEWKQVGILNMKEVTCRETCTEDGCNTGWPARPDCITCNAKEEDSANDECLHAQSASYCSAPHHQHCYSYLQNKSISSGKTEREKYTITRGCSAYKDKTAEGCKNLTLYGRYSGVECTQYCSKDGCNFDTFDDSIKVDKEIYINTDVRPLPSLGTLLAAILCIRVIMMD